MPTADIRQKAQTFCKENHINTYPVNIVQLCNRLGIQVFEEPLPPDVSGMLMVRPEPFEQYGSNRVIVINASHSARRRRFTVAHELAHYVLHKQVGETLFAHREEEGAGGAEERQADAFAACVLMPAPLVLRALGRLKNQGGDGLYAVDKAGFIAAQFGVSEDAARARLGQLGLA